MRRTQIYLEESQDERLTERAEALGTTKSDVIREAIDLYLEGPQDEDARVARFRAALDEVTEAPAALPEGRAYVEALRALESSRREAVERRRR